MSVILMAKVWEMPIPSTAKLVLLSLTDHANDEGVKCWPGQPKIARKCSLTERAVRVQIAWLEERKIIRRVVKAGIGTAYTITLDDYTEPRNDVPPRNNIPPSLPRNDVPPTPEYYSGNPGTTFRQTIIEPSIITKRVAQALPASSGKSKSSKSGTTLQAFLEQCKATGEEAIPKNDPIFTYAEKVGIDRDMVAVVWQEFKAAYLPTKKLQNDWRAHFRNAVRRNWYKLWYLKDGETAKWTSAGEQARRAVA